MRAFSCSRCGSLVGFEDPTCVSCGSTLGYVHGIDRMRALDDDGRARWEGVPRILCANQPLGCNWLVPEGPELEAFCVACRLVRRHPSPGDDLATDQYAAALVAERRLLFQVLENDLPITSYAERDGGLAFDLLSSTTGDPVTIGHADGVVTIDLSETGDAYRESLRVELGEPYRTMLGHFRHETGHYYWQELVSSSPALLARCRELFGDDTADYQQAIDRHYAHGAPDGWRAEFISEYATMHPYEDFAESWAHYLHITDTLQTAASFGMNLGGLIGDKLAPELRGSLATHPAFSVTGYREATMEEILTLWHPLAIAFNQINRSMGKNDLYPFVLTEPVRAKLAFVHEVVSGQSHSTGTSSNVGHDATTATSSDDRSSTGRANATS
ncbi:putative zinc-binding metallopeptidase [Cellulosimicrobium arenosum]|uniref:Zinc-binding metallopeptidase n=1 Tax=Cellulosimicrobium arenosum TaxID=2708133 RepID=A0A927J163_9MICO|nr:putative zinc-binding metallopeptidase [Cellulosimicrobium arenosum]